MAVKSPKAIAESIMKDARGFYEELQSSAQTKQDWERFGRRMHGIFHSYYDLGDPVYKAACLMVLTQKPESKGDREIISGNYGFKKCASKASETAEEEAKQIQQADGDEAAKAYLQCIHPCDRLMIQERVKAGEAVGEVPHILAVKM